MFSTRPEELHSACSAAVNEFKTSQLCTDVNKAVIDHLTTVFGADFSNIPLAVRSSATGKQQRWHWDETWCLVVSVG